MVNRLANENSPYLLQHADNPVDWYPWGEEAIDRAKSENKPILVSVGYAACHWCHVMAHESFEDPATAKIMNEHFINIKVDREERPDLDSIYMNAVVAMTGHGGWPLNVFLTPEGNPFFGGTYFPPRRRHNLPSFQEVLLSVINAWQNDLDQIERSGEKIIAHLSGIDSYTKTDGKLDAKVIEKAALALAQTYDWNYGGWGEAPKFPQTMAIEFLLRLASRGDKLALDMATHALEAMSKGGMYDLVGGGFARYSTDNKWLVPHFEKMLYDNAQLALVYLHAYKLTGNTKFRQIAEATLDFLVREMLHPQGGFYSSLDADSEGVEGKYYVWTKAQLEEIITDASDLELVLAAYGVTERGNFEGANILHQTLSAEELAERYRLPAEAILSKLSRKNSVLRQARENRIRPGTDDKILTVWNGLALVAFSEAARYLDRKDYVEVAMRNAQFLLTQLFDSNRLLRSWRDGNARQRAFLEDYAALALGLLSLYQSDPDYRWYQTAVKLGEEMLYYFADPAGGFFDTPSDHENLPYRPKDVQDNATPSGNSLAATALLQLAGYTGRHDWRERAERMLANIQGMASRYPTAFGNWLCAIDYAAQPVLEVALLGDPSDTRYGELLSVVWEKYRPNLVAALSRPNPPAEAPPLLHNRPLYNHHPTAYVCQNFVCDLPVNSSEDLRAQLESKR